MLNRDLSRAHDISFFLQNVNFILFILKNTGLKTVNQFSIPFLLLSISACPKNKDLACQKIYIPNYD
jgi:hypothetical protein